MTSITTTPANTAAPEKPGNPYGTTIAQRIAAMAPDPASAAEALANFPRPHPETRHCWLWTGSTDRGRPQAKVRQKLNHPVKHLWPQASRVQRICPEPLCVNPWHHIQKPMPPAQPMHELAEDPYDLCQQRRYPTLAYALQMLSEYHSAHYIVYAYREWRTYIFNTKHW